MSAIKLDGLTLASTANSAITIDNVTLASGNTNNIEVIGFSKQVGTSRSSSGILTFSATNAFINGMTESSGTITIQKAGRYFAYAGLYGETSSTSLHYISARIRVNNTDIIGGAEEGYGTTVSGRRGIQAGGLLNVSVNDTVDFYISITGTGQIFSGYQSRCTLFYLGQ